jgi:hypothetical protein
VAIAGQALSLGASERHDLYVNPGAHALEISFDRERKVRRDLTIRPGTESKISIQAPAAAAAAPGATPSSRSRERRGTRGMSPIIAATGVAVTLGLAGATVWSGLDTRRAHDAYTADPNEDRWQAGRTKQLRTNILLGATAGAGVATAVIGVFFTRWRSPERATAALSIEPGGGLGMAIAGRF